ncbi:MAG: MBL fold metallo-hydrolase [Lachnospirales bacterium]
MKVAMIEVPSYSENIYLYYDEDTKKGIIIDIGKDMKELDEYINEKDINLVGIFLTHGHYDHIGGVESFKERHNLKIYSHKDEKEVTSNPDYNISSMRLRKHISFVADELLDDGEVVDFGEFKIEVLHTKGHTVGSCCFLDRENKIVFTGDTMFKENYGRIDLPTSSNDIGDSIKNKLFVLDDDTKVYPGHGGSSLISHEKEYNPIVRFKK